jgi:hypothetical protein
MDIEPRLRKIKGYVYLPTLRAALQRDLKLDGKGDESVDEAA